MAGVLQHLRSSTLNKRPNPASMVDGQIAINYASGSPGAFFKDTNGNLVKVGPVHVGATAPNVSPASGGTAGNSLGEQWLDTSGGTYVFKIWDGAAWRSEAGEFVNSTGDTMTGSLTMGPSANLIFEGSTDDGFETTLTVVDPTADRTITLPNVSGTVVTTGDTGTITSTMIADGTIVDGDINASAAIAGTKISPAFGSQNVTTTGTSTAASFIPTSSTVPTNGVYLPAANSVAISTGGSGRLFVDASGNVAIGSANYTGRLSLPINSTISWHNAGTQNQAIWADSSGNLLFYTANGERLRITSAGLVGVGTSSPSALLSVASTTTSYAAESFNIGEPSLSTGRQLYMGYNTADGVGFIQPVHWGTAFKPLVLCPNGGRVGIGTTSPGQLLSVFDGNITTEGSNASHYVSSGKQGVTTTYLMTDASGGNIQVDGAWPIRFTTNSNERARIDSSGRLLVGTSSSSAEAKFIVQGGATAAGGGISIQRNATTASAGSTIGFINFANSASNVGATISADGDGTWSAGTSHPTLLKFSTTADGASSPTERMRIGNNGKTLISHANDTNVLVCSNAITSGYTSSNISVLFEGYAPNNATAKFLYCADTAAIRAEIRSNGGLANYQANDVNLSDRNAKKDISPAADTWDCIKEWEIVNYRYKDQPDNADLNLGVIAQQVAESCPEVIAIFQEAKEATETEPAQEERLGVKEQQMYWMAIKALQEAQMRIETLEAKVAALESA